MDFEIKNKSHNQVLTKIREDVLKRLREHLGEEVTGVDIEKTVEKHLMKTAQDIEEEINRATTYVYRNVLKDLKKEIEKVEKEKKEEEFFPRLNLHFRIQHMVLFISVIFLILTGLPLKFPGASPLRWLIFLFGGIEISRVVHRISAAGLIFFMAYHMICVVFHSKSRKDFIILMPRPKDFLDFFQNIKYFLGRTSEKPKFDRFSYIEKFDYWAVYWGCVIMIGTGLLLWFEELSMKFLPKFVIDIAKEAHSDEALLATLAIVIWHFYNVHFNPDRFPGTLMWWHGKISEEEMKKEHPLEYERMKREKGAEG